MTDESARRMCRCGRNRLSCTVMLVCDDCMEDLLDPELVCATPLACDEPTAPCTCPKRRVRRPHGG